MHADARRWAGAACRLSAPSLMSWRDLPKLSSLAQLMRQRVLANPLQKPGPERVVAREHATDDLPDRSFSSILSACICVHPLPSALNSSFEILPTTHRRNADAQGRELRPDAHAAKNHGQHA